MASSSNSLPSTGSWNRATGTLVLVLAGDLIAGTAYSFSIVVTNQAQGQAAPSVSAFADRVTTVYSIFQRPSSTGLSGDMDPMFIRSASFVTASSKCSITQSSPVPCNNNNLTVSLTFNVPLFAACAPSVTISGLTGTVTPSGSLGLVSTGGSTGFSTADLANVWNRLDGTLTVNVTKSGQIGGDVTTGETSIVFNVPLKNPASGQDAPVLSVVGSFGGVSFGPLLSGHFLASSSGHPDDGLGGDSYNITQGVSSNAPQLTMLPLPTLYSQFPLFVVTNHMWTFVAQSSPFPCAANTLTFALQGRVSLLGACNPVITIGGLGGTATPDNASLPVSFVSDGSSANFQRLTTTLYGNWSQKAGNLTINMTSAVTAVSMVDILVFQITLANAPFPDSARSLCTPPLACDRVVTGVTSVVSTSLGGTAFTDSQWMAGYGSAPAVFGGTPLVAGTTFSISQAASEVVAAIGDALPLNLRSLTFNMWNSQTSANPCDNNAITVTLRVSVPVFTTCLYKGAVVQTNVTLSGLVGSTTPSGAINVVSSGSFASTGMWLSSGSLVLTPATTLIASTQASASGAHTIIFTLTNQQSANAGSFLTATSSPYSSSSNDNTNGGVMSILPLNWSTKIASQSTPWPCAPNTISITLQPFISLLSTCKASAADSAGRPNITISGLTGTTTGNNASLAVMASSSNSLPSTGSWNRATGTLVLVLAGDLIAGTAYSFSIVVTNQAQGQAAPSVSAFADRVSLNPVSSFALQLDPPNGTSENNAMFIRTPSMVSLASQTNSYPCYQNNQISVTVTVNVPFFALCTPELSMLGLTGSTTSSISDSFISSSNSSAVSWNPVDGSLRFGLIPTSLPPTPADGTGNQVVFSFIVSNGASGQTPSVNVVLKFNGTQSCTYTFPNPTTTPLYIQTPKLLSGSAQNSPYPCDRNTITFQFQPNVPIYVICTPKLIIQGLQGSAKDTQLNADGQLTLLSTSHPSLASPAAWDMVSGSMNVSFATDILSASPAFFFSVTIRNQATFQSAPTVSVVLQYTTMGGSTPAALGTVVWSMGTLWTMSTIFQPRTPAVSPWTGDPGGSWTAPLYIRAPSFNTAWMSQKTALAGAVNTISTSLNLNVDLISLCRPQIVITNLIGACVTSAPDLMLAPSNPNNDHLNFWSLSNRSGYGTFSSSTLTLLASIGVSSQVGYMFSFNITNPVQGQQSPLISIQIQNTGAIVPSPVMPVSRDSSTPAASGSYTFAAGDAMPLRVITPQFEVRSIYQLNPLPGQLNTFVVTIRASIALPDNSVITISGFLPNTPSDPSPSSRLDLAVSGPLQLDNTQNGNSLLALVKDSAGPSGTGTLGNGNFDRALGRLALYVTGAGLGAGINYAFQFKLRNPQCSMSAVQPCIRASRINAGCVVASLDRNLMTTFPATVAGMSSQTELNVDGSIVPSAQLGEALPLQVRQPLILAAYVQQSSAFPCDSNELTFLFRTSVPLVNALGQKLVFYGLKGMRGNYSVAMPGGLSQLPVKPVGSYEAATWDPVQGTLTVPVSSLEAGIDYQFSVPLTNPSAPQQCATSVTMAITGMCFSNTSVGWPLPNWSSDITSQGPCTGGSGTATLLTNGTCPLTVVDSILYRKVISQSSPYPCDPNNIITVSLISSVPIFNCAGVVALSGLGGALTVRSSVTIGSVSVSSFWNAQGGFNFSSSGFTSSSCQPIAIFFSVRNPKFARDSASPQITFSGFSSSTMSGVLPLTKFSQSADANASVLYDPLFVLAPQFTTKTIGQASPWPGFLNTLTVTLQTNVPLWSDCAVIVIGNLEEACATVGPIALAPNPSGFTGGLWSTQADNTGRVVQQGRLTMNVAGVLANGDSTSGTALCSSIACNPHTEMYIFSFMVSNPVNPQNSPPVMIYGDDSAGGVRIVSAAMDKDLGVPSTVAGCAGNACAFVVGDAAPLRVYAPMFLISSIGQSMPYPGKNNTISVTLLSNLALQPGSSITISNLLGAQTPSSSLQILGSSSFTPAIGGPSGYGTWDLVGKSLTLFVSQNINAGTQLQFSFQLLNPACGQESPPVCVRAGDVSPTNCSQCSQGACSGTQRTLMTRNLTQTFSTGTVGTLYPYDKYNSLAQVTYGDSIQGDAYPLKVYSPAFVVSKIGQSTHFPSRSNNISVTLATNVPLIAGSTVTISNLTGSSTASTLSLLIFTPDSVFGSAAQWTQRTGTIILTVVSETVAGMQYRFQVDLANPQCPQSPRTVMISSSPLCFSPQPMCADMATPSSTLPFFQPAPGDAQPLYVKPGSFLQANVWQKTPYGGYDNYIHVEFSFNTILPSNTLLSVTGLNGIQTADSSSLPLSFVDDSDSQASSSMSRSLLSSTASWSQSQGVLTISTTSETAANLLMRFRVLFRNPACCQPARIVQLSTNLLCLPSVVAAWKNVTADVVLENVNETRPLFTRCSRWVQAAINTSNAYPCTKTDMWLVLQLNVPVRTTDNVLITISGLFGSLTASGNVSLVSDAFTQLATWNQTTGTLALPPLSRNISAYETFMLRFSLINPSDYTNNKVLVVTVSATICNSAASNLVAVVQQQQQILFITAPALISATITQKTSWPGGANLLTVTLQANMPLYGADMSCPIFLQVAGLVGICSRGATGVNVSLSGTDSAGFGNGLASWNLESKALTSVRLLTTLDVARVFTLAVTNNAESRPSPLITVAASGIPFNVSSIVVPRSSSYAPPDTIGQYGSQQGVIYNATAAQGDGEALRIQAPAFIVKRIGQSTSWPGAVNQLTVTFSANLDLQIGSVIIIASINYLDGSSAAPTGPVTLYGADAWRFAASSIPAAPTSQGLWDDTTKNLRLHVASNLTAASGYVVSFNLSNPACGQVASPVCIRAHGIVIGCSSDVKIVRMIMDAATGDSAPFYVRQPVITRATIVHSNPFAAAINQMSLVVRFSVPVATGSVLSIVGLSGSMTPASVNSLAVSMSNGGVVTALTANFSNVSSLLTLSPVAMNPDMDYTFNFSLLNGQCNQKSPAISVSVGGLGLCFQPRVVDPIAKALCNIVTGPLEIVGAPCQGQGGSSSLFTQKLVGQSTPYPGCDNVITLSFSVNVPLPVSAGVVVVVDFADRLFMDVVRSLDNVLLDGPDASKFFGSTSVVDITVNSFGSNCTCIGSSGMLIFTPAANDTGRGAAGTYSLVNGMLASVQLINGGSGYLVPPVVTLNTSCSVPPSVTAQMSFGSVRTSKGRWDPVNKTLNLGVAVDLVPCNTYTVNFTVRNPVAVTSPSSTPSILQDAQSVYISSTGIAIAAVEMNYTDAYLRNLAGVSSSQGDYLPMRVHAPRFFLKTISQSTPYPGATSNLLTVSFSTNTMLRVGSRLAVSGLADAMGVVVSRGDLPLRLVDGMLISDGNFRSDVASTSDQGTWMDCEKALVIVANRDLSCNATVYVLTFEVSNPVTPRGCAPVRINVTNIPNPAGYVPTLTGQITSGDLLGQFMDHDLDRVLTNIPGSTKGDACALKIWPAAFTMKGISQSSPFPCAVNVITVTMAVNVPLPAFIKYRNVADVITPSITISRISGAITGGVGTAPAVPLPGDVGPDVVSSSAASRVISLTRSEAFNDTAWAWQSNAGLFSSIAAGSTALSQAVWSPSASSGEVSLQLFVANVSGLSLFDSNQMLLGCSQIRQRIRISFRVFNPSQPQTPAQPISISASGIPIPASAMQQDIGNALPMFISQGTLSAVAVQSSSSPCSWNTVTVTLSSTIDIWPRCAPVVSVAGLQLTSWPKNLSSVGTLINATAVDMSVGGRVVAGLGSSVWPSNTALVFTLLVRNPSFPVSFAAAPYATVTGVGLATVNASTGTGLQTIPGVVDQPKWVKTEIWQSSSYPSRPNSITVTLQVNVNLEATCGVAIVISNLTGLCFGWSNITLEDASSGSGADRFSAWPGVTASSGGTALWDQKAGTLTLYVVRDIVKGQDYAFRFRFVNGAGSQAAAAVNVESRGINISAVAMTRIAGVSSVTFQAVPEDSLPLLIKLARSINATASQSTADPDVTNTITLSFVTDVPLTADPPTTIYLSGLTGARAVDGALNVTCLSPSISFVGNWNDARKQASFRVVNQDTVAGTVVQLQFSVTNPAGYQSNPSLSIETAGGVVMQRSPVQGAGGLNSPLMVNGPRLTVLSVVRASSNKTYPGAKDSLVLTFSPTVDLVPTAGQRTSLVLSGLAGMSQTSGVVNVSSSPTGVFTACAALNTTTCVLNQGRFADSSSTLTLGLASTVTRNTLVTVTFACNYALLRQAAPQLWLEVTRSSAGVIIPPTPVPTALSLSADLRALNIYGSAGFLISSIGQSSTVPAGSNTITVVIQPAEDIVANSSLTISGLVGAATPSGALRIYDMGSVLFSSVGSWDRKSGSLVLIVAIGQTVSASASTTLRFDLTNPLSAQPSSDEILISASGPVPFGPTRMGALSGSDLPLLVRTYNFSDIAVGQSSPIPGGPNVITATLRTNAVLRKSMQSVVVLEGLIGATNSDNEAMPLTMIEPSLANGPPLFSPFDDVFISATDSCRFTDGRVLVSGLGKKVDLSGTLLYFTQGACVNRWVRVASFDTATGCANLSASFGVWEDGASPCQEFGRVQGFQVTASGSGYKPGDSTTPATEFIINTTVSLVPGSGLTGRCLVNLSGAVTGVTVTQRGSMYTSDVTVICPSDCQKAPTSASSCSSTPSGQGLAMKAVLETVRASVVAGAWRRSTGSLKLVVRDQILPSTLVRLSFGLSNGLAPQAAQQVMVLASGSPVVPSTRMTGASGSQAPMLIGQLTLSQSLSCESSGCVVGSPCSCAGGFSGVPVGRQVYSLRAEVQCNGGGGAFNVTAPAVTAIQSFLTQPPAACKGMCDARFALLPPVDVTSAVTQAGGLDFGASVSAAGQDFCMAGKHLKVYFTLQYSAT